MLNNLSGVALHNYLCDLPSLASLQNAKSIYQAFYRAAYTTHRAVGQPGSGQSFNRLTTAARKVEAADNVIEKRTKDKGWCLHYRVGYLGEADIDPSELASAVPDSAWRITKSVEDKNGRRKILYTHKSGVSFKLINVFFDTPTFMKSMLWAWDVHLYDPKGSYIDGEVNMLARTPEKAFEKGKAWALKSLRDYSRSMYRAAVTESDDPLDPSVLASTIPDYVNGILSVDDSDVAENEEPPQPVNVNAVTFLRTKSYDWLKNMRRHAAAGGSPSVWFGTEGGTDNSGATWTYAALMGAPAEFVEYVKRNECELQLEMHKDKMLDWIAAWLVTPQR